MLADEFASRLKLLALNIEELAAKGLSRTWAENFVKTYDCPKKRDGDANLSIDPILDLLNRYDTTTLEIGIITLNPEGEDRSDQDKLFAQKKTLIGSLEADPLEPVEKLHEVLFAGKSRLARRDEGEYPCWIFD